MTAGAPREAKGEPGRGAAWEREAEAWIRFCPAPDAFAWKFNIPAFLDMVPPPGRLTLDIGCGEGRVARELMKRSHTVKAVDASGTLVAAARAGDPPVDAIEADAAALPLNDGEADTAVAFMALQSVDDLEGADISFTFNDIHRPLSQYTAALARAGFVIEELREPIPPPEVLAVRPSAERWTRTPSFLHFRARRG